MRSIFGRARRTSSGLDRTRGAGAIEYALLLGLIALVAVAVVTTTTGKIARILCVAGSAMSRDACGIPDDGGNSPSGPNTSPDITTTNLPQAYVGHAYFFQINATDPDGDPVSFSLTGSEPPPGISFDRAGAVAGTPTKVGAFTLNVAAADWHGAKTLRAFSFDVSSAPIWETPEGALSKTLPLDQAIVPIQLRATDLDGDAVTYVLAESTALPQGLSLSPTGVISGTPTKSGKVEFKVAARDPLNASVRAFSIRVNSPPVWRTPSGLLPGLYQTRETSPPYALQATDEDDQTLTFVITSAAGTFPDGLTLDPITGVISGTPTMDGLYAFIVTVSDEMGIGIAREFQIWVSKTLCGASATIVSTAGSSLITVPDRCTTAFVKLWGAGGASGQQSIPPGIPGNGGAGGFASGMFDVSDNETLLVFVGQGGRVVGGTSIGGGGGSPGPHAFGGGGGGYSGIFRGGIDVANALLIAGGGGGGGGADNRIGKAGHGGVGGGETGGTGGTGGGTSTGGGGGSQAAGGAGGVGSLGGPGTPGGSLQGGTGGFRTVDGGAGGGGGGGYFGGGGGGGTGIFAVGGSGGGGSSWIHPTLLRHSATSPGTGQMPPYTTDAAYLAGSGIGGVWTKAEGLPGGDALAVIYWR